MSYQRMVEREPQLAAIVAQILAEAEAVDAAEDERYGDARGDELPEQLRTKQGTAGSDPCRQAAVGGRGGAAGRRQGPRP
jgi:hypothetical protein